MGSAMARGWIGARRVLVYDPMIAQPPPGTERVASLDEVVADDLVVVLAVKPQSFASLATQLQPLARQNALFVSIMAGVTTLALGEALGASERIVRAMPNTPAAIGRGITAAVCAAQVNADDRALVESLFAATGAFVWLDNEAQLDLVTAVSGSGPAYFFRFAEALASAGTAAGLPADLAMQLARATFTGAAALAEQDAATTLADLRQQVTSPGGTTAAGLAALDGAGPNGDAAIDTLVASVVDAAATRSRELNG